jgi:Spy/CpxP family protein refolding chaperone
MSLKSKFFSFLTVAISVVAFSTFTFAQEAASPDKGDKAARHEGRMGHGKGFHGRRGGMRGHGLHMLVKTANLTDAQKLQIQSIKEANKPDEALRTEMQTLRAAKRDGTITAAQQARLVAIRDERKAKMQAVHAQIMNILTPEQKALVEAKKAEMKQRREERRQMWQDRKNKPVTTEAPKTN